MLLAEKAAKHGTSPTAYTGYMHHRRLRSALDDCSAKLRKGKYTMPAALVADFDKRSKALDAVQRLTQAGIPRSHIDTYPSLEERAPTSPSAGEKVAGAETEMSSNGPLGHLQSLLARLFGVETSKPQTQGAAEPTSEAFAHESVYMAIGIEGLPITAETVRGLLTDAGAIRIDEHAA